MLFGGCAWGGHKGCPYVSSSCKGGPCEPIMRLSAQCEKAVEATIARTYPLMPVMVIPSTKVRCTKKKMRITGAMVAVLAAII